MAVRERVATGSILAGGSPLRLGLILFAFALLFRFFDAVARTFLIGYAAAILAIALNVFVRRLPLERKWAALLVGGAVVVLLFAALFFGGSIMLDQLRGLLTQTPEIQAQIRSWADAVHARTGIHLGAVSDPLREALTGIATGGGGILGRVRGVFGAIALALIVLFGGLFALAKPNSRLLTPVLRAIPPEHHPPFRRALDLLAQRLVGWIEGQILAMVIVGTMATLLFLLIGVPYAFLLGVFNGLTELIPILGPWIGGATAATVAAVTDPTKGMLVAGAAVFIQLTENTLILPLVMQNRAKVHPFVTLLALLFFGALFGFLGILLAIPLVLLIWTAVEVFWVDRHLWTNKGPIEPVVEE
jgi:predicted PurR-regulated permease PerM